MRFKLFTLLSFVAVAAFVCHFLFRPPRVTFGDAEYHVRDLSSGERLLDVTIPVKNAGLFPVWFRDYGIYDTLAISAVKNGRNEVRLTEAYYAISNWKKLQPGKSVNVKELRLNPMDQVGIQLTDWLGRSHLVFHPNLDIRSVWKRRYELPTYSEKLARNAG